MENSKMEETSADTGEAGSACAKKRRKLGGTRLQLAVAVGLVTVGCVLLGCAFIAPPKGEIHPSVLVAFGEILTFAGALFGIDYHYVKLGVRS